MRLKMPSVVSAVRRGPGEYQGGSRARPLLATTPALLSRLRSSARSGREYVAVDEQMAKQWVMALYTMRQERRSHPEGKFDKQRRWYPSIREDCNDVIGKAWGPSKAWPYNYMLRARTKTHCRQLVYAALWGQDVPDDVWRCCPAREKFTPGTALGEVRDYVLDGCPKS